MQTQITDAGLALMEGATEPIVLTSFELGSAYGYIPDHNQTALKGTVVYTGVPGSPVVQDANTILYPNLVPDAVGPFQFGEVGLFYGTTLFAVITFDSLLTKLPLDLVTNTGGAIIIDAFIPTVGSNYQMWAVVTQANTNKVSTIAGPELLPPSVQASPNIYVVAGPVGSRPFLAFSDLTNLWSFDGYKDVATSTVSSSAVTSVTVPSSDVQGVTFNGEGSLLVQFSTGSDYSVVRAVSALTTVGNLTTFSFTVPMNVSAPAGTGLHVYEQSAVGKPSGLIGPGVFTTLQATGNTSLGPTTATSIDGTPIGASIPSSGSFTTLKVSGAATLGAVQATSLDGTPVGLVTPEAAKFTDLTVTGSFTGPGLTAIWGSPGIIGSQTPNSAFFTTVHTSGQTTLGATTAASLDNTPIGSTTPSSGKFTTLLVQNAVTLNGLTNTSGPTTLGATNIESLTVPGAANFGSFSASSLDGTPIGANVAASGKFTTLAASGATTLGALTAGAVTATSLDSTPVGSNTPSTGAFTTLAASQGLTVVGEVRLSGGDFSVSGSAGLTGQVLTSQGPGSEPVWSSVTTGGSSPTFSGLTVTGPSSLAGLTATTLGLSQPLTSTSQATFTALTLTGNTEGLTINGNAGSIGQFLVSQGPGAAPIWQTSNFSTAHITAGSIDGTPIGASVPAAGTFTSLSLAGVTSPLNLNNSAGAYGQVLTSQGAGQTPIWTTPSGGGGATGAADITSGTINNTAIGNTTPSTGAFTTLSSAGVTNLNGAVTVTGTFGLTANTAFLINGSAGTTGEFLVSQGPGTAPIWSSVLTVNGGSVDNAPVGATTPSTGSFTTLAASQGLALSGSSSPLSLNNSTGATGTVLTSQGPGKTPIWGPGNSSVAPGSVTPAALSTGGPSWDTAGNLTATSFVGNASTASKLAAPVNINGVPFDGSSSVSINVTESQVTPAAGILARLANNQTITGTWSFSTPPNGPTPVNPTDLVNKAYTDAAINGLAWKTAANVASTGNLTLSGIQTIDGVTGAANLIVLVKNQTNAVQNGAYVMSSGTWARATFMNATTPTNEFTAAALLVLGGSQAGTAWVQTATVNTIGVDNVSFTQFNTATSYTPGLGLQASGGQLNVISASSSRITVSSGGLDLAAITNAGGGSMLKLTVDGYGRVTGTSPMTASDVEGLISGQYVPLAGGVTMTGSLGLPANGLTVGGSQLMVSGGNVSASGQLSAASIQGTPIGTVTPAAGVFTTITATNFSVGGAPNAVVYANSAGNLTTSASFVFDGKNLGVGITPVTPSYGTQLLVSQGSAAGGLLQQSVAGNDERLYLLNNLAVASGTGFTGNFTFTKTGAAATAYLQTAGVHSFLGSSATGTAGATATMNTWATISAQGIGFGVTPVTALDITTGSSTNRLQATDAASASGVRIRSRDSGGTTPLSLELSGADIRFLIGTATTPSAILDSGGSFAVGFGGNSWSTGWKAIELSAAFMTSNGVNTALWGSNLHIDGSGTLRYVAAGAASYYEQNVGAHYWYSVATGAAGAAATSVPLAALTTVGLGVGTSPSAWGSGYTAIQVGPTSSVYGSGVNTVVATNYYNNGTTNTYIQNGIAASYIQNQAGGHIWYSAPSGSAGNAVALNQLMSLDASGNLTVAGSVSFSGSFAPSGDLFLVVPNSGSRYLGFQYGGTNRWNFYTASTDVNTMVLENGTTRVMTFYNNSNVGMGTVTAPAEMLHLSGNILLENASYYKGKNSTGALTRLLGMDASNDVWVGSRDAVVNNLHLTSNGTDWAVFTAAGAGLYGAPNANCMVSVGASNPLTGAIQEGVFVGITGTANGTAALMGFNASMTTASANYTLAYATDFYASLIGKGSGSTITNAIGYYGTQQTNGANNAVLADTTNFVGNWFVNQAGTTPSYFGGNIGIGTVASAWGSNSAVETPGGALWSGASTSVLLGQNLYQTGATGTYYLKATGASSLYYQNAGVHGWYSNASGSAGTSVVPTLNMTLDLHGNLGLGAVADAWGTTGTVIKAIQLGSGHGFVAGGMGVADAYLGCGAYYNGTSWVYTASGQAPSYLDVSGASGFRFYSALAGTAGNNATFTQVASIDTSGNLNVNGLVTSAGGSITVGNGSPNGVAYFNGSKVLSSGNNLTFNGTGVLGVGQGGTGSANTSIYLSGTSAAAYGSSIIGLRNGANTWSVGDTAAATGAGTGLTFYTYGATGFYWNQAGTVQMELNASGNLLVGTTTDSGARATLNGNGTNGVLTLTGSTTSTSPADVGIFRTGGTESATPGQGSSIQLGNLTTGSQVLVQQYADNLQVFNYTGNSWTERMRLDANGNLGLNIVPPTGLASSEKSVWVKGSGAPGALVNGFNATIVQHNLYYDGTAHSYYVANDYASAYTQVNGQHQWTVAPSGTAGNVVTQVQAMTLANNGNLGLNVTPSGWESGAKVMEYDTSGAGGTAASTGSIWARGDSIRMIENLYYNGTNYIYKGSTAGAAFTVGAGTFSWQIAQAGTAGGTASLAQSMVLDINGNLGVSMATPGTFGKVVSQPSASGYNPSGSIAGAAFVGYGAYGGGYALVDGSYNWIMYDNLGTMWWANGTSLGATTNRMGLDGSGNLMLGGGQVGGGKLSVTTTGAGVVVGGNTSAVATSEFAAQRSGTDSAVAGQGANIQFSNSTSGTAVSMQNYSGNTLFFRYSAGGGWVESARIDNNGEFMVGYLGTSQISTNASGFCVTPDKTGGAAGIYIGHTTSAASATSYAQFLYNGSVIGQIAQNGTSAVSYNTTSDPRLKNITGPLTTSGAFFDAANPVVGTWKSDDSYFAGFLTDEYQKLNPGAVIGEPGALDEAGNPIYQQMEYADSVWVANVTAEIKSLRTRVQTLEDSNATLEQKLQSLLTQVQTLAGQVAALQPK